MSRVALVARLISTAGADDCGRAVANTAALSNKKERMIEHKDLSTIYIFFADPISTKIPTLETPNYLQTMQTMHYPTEFETQNSI
jgi:hypothetical protein